MAVNENVADMPMGEGSSPDNTGAQIPPKQQRPQNRPKQPRAGAAIEPVPPAKKKKGGRVKVIIIIVLVLLIGSFVFLEVSFELVGLRRMIVSAAMELDPEAAVLRERAAALDLREAELGSLQAELEQRENQATSRETQLERRRADIAAQEEDLRERELKIVPIYRRPMSEEELEDMQSLSSTYARIDPETAAEILAELDNNEDIAAILYYMSERSTAAILSAMETELAAELTLILLYYS